MAAKFGLIYSAEQAFRLFCQYASWKLALRSATPTELCGHRPFPQCVVEFQTEGTGVAACYHGSSIPTGHYSMNCEP
jgi:hypothetical protein